MSLWNTHTHDETLTFPVFDIVYDLEFSFDGAMLMACTHRGKLHVWNAPRTH